MHGWRAPGLEVDTSNRQEVVNFFFDVYLPALAVPSGWTGSTASCATGTTHPSFVPATLQMVNYFRAMTGLPADVGDEGGARSKADEAALMMKANSDLSHSPPSSWACYTADGAEAAGRSNLALGVAGAAAIHAYVRDSGSSNDAVGHRRWVLYPPLVAVGSGETNSSNSLWVLPTTEHPLWGARPSSPEWVAWPPEGHVPYQVVFSRWSLARNASADFGGATVGMSVDGVPVAVNQLPVHNGYGDNTLVWEVSGNDLPTGPLMADRVASVTVSDILVGGTPTTVSYDVIVIDPAVSPDRLFGDDFETGDTGSWSHSVP